MGRGFAFVLGDETFDDGFRGVPDWSSQLHADTHDEPQATPSPEAPMDSHTLHQLTSNSTLIFDVIDDYIGKTRFTQV